MNPEIFKAMLKFAVKQARSITDDQEALEVKCLYKQWNKQLGKPLEVGEYIQHGNRLYRVLQKHIAQDSWEPGVGTESLYVVIDKTHAGTEVDPIPWTNNMECFNGKFYIEDNILYLCVRDSGIALQCKIVDVLGNYFKRANDQEEPEEEEPEIEEPEEEEPEIEEPEEEEPEIEEPEIEEPEIEEPEIEEPEIEEPEIEEPEIEDWVQPDSTNPYMNGALVTYNGKVWVSSIDNNVWEPGIYGWVEQ